VCLCQPISIPARNHSVSISTTNLAEGDILNSRHIYLSTYEVCTNLAKIRFLAEWSLLEPRQKYLLQLRNKIYNKELELMDRGYIINATILRDACLEKVHTDKEPILCEFWDS
jgi:hypothetical protein